MQIEARLSEADKREIAETVAAMVLAKLAPSEPPGTLLTEQRSAAELGVEPHCLRDCRKRGEIQFHRIGKFVRYSREQLDDFKRRIVSNGRPK